MEKLKGQLIMHTIVIVMLAMLTIQTSVDRQLSVDATTTTAMLKSMAMEEELSSMEVQEEVMEAKEAVKVIAEQNDAETTLMTESKPEPKEPTYSEFAYNAYNANDLYLLAKIAMAEAEGESVHTKTLVVLTVLNRVQSDDFPNTIEDVIFEEHDGVYQFSPVMPGGRWWTTEPNEECYQAAKIAITTINDCSKGALYFESCTDEDNWHSRNLEFLYESEGIRFYK